MAGLNLIGSYSGIDQNTINQLMEAERIPLKHLTNKQVNINEKKDAWKDVNTRLSSLFERMKDLKNSNSFDAKIITSSNDKFVSMSAGMSAAEGRYDIKVGQLATNSSLIGTKVEFEETEDGKPGTVKLGGSFTIKNGDKEPSTAIIKVDSTDTLKDIVDKINKTTKDYKVEESDEEVTKGSGTGISATIVDGRIVLTDEKTGARNITLENKDGEEILDKIGLDENSTKFKEDTSADNKLGNGAEFTINGIKITRDTNTISDAIEGVTLNLNKVHDKDNEGDFDTITVSADTEKAAKAMQDFVDQYNSTMKFIEEKTAAGDPKIKGSKGILAGESSLMRLQSTLRTLVTDSLQVNGSSINDVSQIGISTIDRYGELKFDKEKFLNALENDKDNVTNFLNPKGEGQVGLADRVNTYIDSFISKDNGLIKSQNESFEKSLKDLSTRIENFEARMVKKEAYYIKMFTALDLAMMKAEDQMGWLQGQVDAMNGIKR